MNEGKYNIKAVSTITGIQPGTLRAWERRYHILEPVRNDAGHRLYTEEHIRKLKWLSEKVQQGLTISQAVAIFDQHETEPGSYTYVEAAEMSQQEVLFEELLQALLRFDEVKAQELINKGFALYTIDHVTIHILAPLLIRIGKLWEEGEITTAHEHFATSILRSRIGMVMHSFPHNGVLPKVVAVCGPGEWHELGLLIFTLFVRRLGYEVVYLGASLKEKEGDIFTVIDIVKPKFLFFSCAKFDNIAPTIQLANKLKAAYSNMEIGIGGSAMNGPLLDGAESYAVGETQQEWNQWMNSRL
ncbi:MULTISPECIES: B12-binding domain-containing protein [Bacillaceae]|uniref:MerR family transcriptional regulator n=1 Tax=Domibacillus aminovorans TaxID=29332 RepID=A0A177KS04_9BACI|nr:MULTISPECIES: B12-binding domain-containing protein [Bacillaceae]OAH55917.1 MerR family transcriptional regulator [Domibacillus aminovorans]